MKLSSSKPTSSPGRTTEKYPPPLMRFLRSNVGNKSRGRSSKSSPMFVRKKISAANSSTTTNSAETQEPSSPKVTCIGQVRVRRSNKSCSSRRSSGSRAVRMRKRCRWVANALFCRNFHRGNGKCDFKMFKPILSKWVLFFRFGCRKKSEHGDNRDEFAEKVENFDRHYFPEKRFSEEHEKEHEEREDDEINDDDDEKLVSCSTTPPKNAFLLTRCRSAPYRSSSLATRFWASPQITTEDGKKSPKMEIINTILENKSSSVVVDHQESEEIIKICSENETELGKTGEEEIEEEEDDCCSSVIVTTSSRPLLLTRCKSEPASRAAEKIYPEIFFSGK